MLGLYAYHWYNRLLLFTGGSWPSVVLSLRRRYLRGVHFCRPWSLPGWVVGMSIFATYVSSISYLGYPGKAFSGDWNAFVFSLSIPIASYFAARYFVPFTGVRTAYRLIAFGKPFRSLGSYICFVLLSAHPDSTYRVYSVFVGVAHECIVGMAYPDHYCCNPVWLLCFIPCWVAWRLSFGQRPYRDLFWSEVRWYVCLFCFWYARRSGADFPSPWKMVKFSLGSFGKQFKWVHFWVCLIYGIFTNLQNYGIDQKLCATLSYGEEWRG